MMGEYKSHLIFWVRKKKEKKMSRWVGAANRL